jgi:hypothetical protein
MSVVFNFTNSDGQRDACLLNEDFNREIYITQDDGVTAWNLTGVTGRMQVKEKAGSGAALLDFATSEVVSGPGGMTITAGTGKIALFKAKSVVRAALKPRAYKWDIVLKKDGVEYVSISGDFIVEEGVTL